MKKSVLAPALLLLGACSPRTIAVRAAAQVLERGEIALYSEPDPRLAEQAMPAELELTEAFLANDPRNRALLKSAAEGFCGYSFLFVEDKDSERAKALYLRGRDYALRALSLGGLKDAVDMPEAAFEVILRKMGKRDVPFLFWAAFGWSSWINLSRDSPQALAQIPRAQSLMQRVMELSPGYHFAGPELFFGSYYASRPAILGGDSRKAKAYFEKARKLTAGKYLMAYVLEARYLAVALQDKALFIGLLKQVQDSPIGRIPEAALTDQVAKEKAAWLMSKIDDYF